MSRRPGPIPPNATPLVVIAAIIAPIVVRNAKPIVRAAGRAAERAGSFLQRLAEDCPCKDKAEEPEAAEAPETPVEAPSEPTEVADPAPESEAPEPPKKPAPKRPKKKAPPKRPAAQA